jgi:hypothetical protein
MCDIQLGALAGLRRFAGLRTLRLVKCYHLKVGRTVVARTVGRDRTSRLRALAESLGQRPKLGPRFGPTRCAARVLQEADAAEPGAPAGVAARRLAEGAENTTAAGAGGHDAAGGGAPGLPEPEAEGVVAAGTGWLTELTLTGLATLSPLAGTTDYCAKVEGYTFACAGGS